MMRADVALESVLRRALARAGIVEGYNHVCRRKGCTHREEAPDAVLRRCPVDKRKLWPKPIVRPLRFHDLRHTTASLLMMSGANAVAVQRILRHTDPKITTQVYGHLAPEYLRAEVDRLRLGGAVESDTGPAAEPSAAAINADFDPLAASLLQASADDPGSDVSGAYDHQEIPGDLLARHAEFESATFGFGGDQP